MLKKMFAKIKAQTVAAKVAVMGVMAAMMVMPVCALSPVEVVPLTTIGKIAETMLNILRYIGLVFIVWGGFQFGMAMKDEDAASKSKAIMVLVAGVLMVGLKALLKGFGLIA